MNGNVRTRAAHAPPSARSASSRGRGWLILTLLVLFAVGATGGAWWYVRIRPNDPNETTPAGPDLGSNEPKTEPDSCSDDVDPKYLERLEFGPPVEVPFQRGPLDGLSDRPLPPLEVFPWQPRGLVAVFGEHRMRGYLLATSPDGKQLALGSPGSGYVRIGPTETLRETAVILCPVAARKLCWSPTGRSLAVSGEDGVVRLYDIRDLDRIPAPVSMEKVAVAGLITCLSFSGDGKYLLGGDDTVRQGIGWVWDVATQKVANRLAHVGPVMSVAFSPVPGDYRALTAGGPEDGQLHLWDALTVGKNRAVIDFRKPPEKHDTTTVVGDVAFSPDGKRALSCHPDLLVRVWDLSRFEKGKELHSYGGHAATPIAAFSPDGKYVTTARGADNGVWLWDATQVRQVRKLAVSPGA